MVLGGIFNAFPYTTYSQNVGLVQLTGVRNRVIIYTCGGMLIALGFIQNRSYYNNYSEISTGRCDVSDVRYGYGIWY